LTPPVEENPESLFRKPRKSLKARRAAETPDQPDSERDSDFRGLATSIEAPFANEHPRTDYSDPYVYPDEADPRLLPEGDPEQVFYRIWGYLPPLDEEAAAIIESIISDPGLAKMCARINPDHKYFPEGLADRNVNLAESTIPDPYADHIRGLGLQEPMSETGEEMESYGQVWSMDRAKCKQGSNEALFQRIMMMSLIARHRFIYGKDAAGRHTLDFSVEGTWTCPPMPTRAYRMQTKFLTQPKPDLAVSFHRQALITQNLWRMLPQATKGLACYEDVDEAGRTKVFHFFTIEAKKAMISADDTVGKRQSLNNASQALHKLFEFFRDAGTEHEKAFFAKVRFFSVVASTEGVTVRIHRAVQEPVDDDPGLIMDDDPGYPLRFEHEEFLRIPKDCFDRRPVVEMFERILLGYGAGELHKLLGNAAKAIVENLRNDPAGTTARANSDFYRHGQTTIPSTSKRQTPAASRAPSVQNNMSTEIRQIKRIVETLARAPSETNMSLDMPRSGMTTPTQSGVRESLQALNMEGKRKGKRAREQSEDTESARSTQRRKR
jgi:hypothetical protein